jgi:3-hydroxyisobutyrate dehydrogenase
VTRDEITMNIAVLGMGRMGQAIAERALRGGHRVSVWNRSPRKADGVVAAGGEEAPTVAVAVDGADVVITMLSNDQAVRAVAFGELRAAIGPGTVYVDSSTVSPELSGELAAAFPSFVALPVLGGPAAVREGHAVFLAGGDSAVVDSLNPLLTALGPVRRYGTAQLALTAKLTNNLLLLAEVAALAEAVAVGRSGGLSDDELRGLLEDNPLLPSGLKNRFEGVLTGAQEGWWTPGLGAKDAGLAIAIAGAAGVTLPVGEAVRRLYDRAAASGHGDADIAEVAALYGAPRQRATA